MSAARTAMGVTFPSKRLTIERCRFAGTTIMLSISMTIPNSAISVLNETRPFIDIVWYSCLYGSHHTECSRFCIKMVYVKRENNEVSPMSIVNQQYVVDAPLIN